MASSNLKIDIRRNKILELLRQNGKVYVTELSQTLSATPVTIRNDLKALENEGHLTRMSGGAVLSGKRAALSAGNEAEADPRYSEKRAIAKAITKQLKDGDTLFLNSGTTTQIVAEELKLRKNLNVVTNSLAVATTLADVPSVCVILLGGGINAQYGFTYGGDAQEQLSRYRADWAVLSVDSIAAETGVTTFHAEEAIIDRMMMSGAAKTLIAADYTKIGRAGFSQVCECGAGIRLITNSKAGVAQLDALMRKGVQVTLA